VTDCLREARVPLHARDSLPLLLLRGAVVCVYPTWRAAVLQPPLQQQPGGEAAAAAAMLASIQAACKASKLLPFETPTAIALVDNSGRRRTTAPRRRRSSSARSSPRSTRRARAGCLRVPLVARLLGRHLAVAGARSDARWWRGRKT
jgi:hypothetical protein